MVWGSVLEVMMKKLPDSLDVGVRKITTNYCNL